MSIPSSCMAAITIGFNFPGSIPALNASNSWPKTSLRNASAIWLRALLWMQTNRNFFFAINDRANLARDRWRATAVFFTNAAAGRHSQAGAEDRRDYV